MPKLEYQLYYQRNLPHYQPPGATLFITFRLAGSLPVEAIQRLEAETHHKQTEIERIIDPQARKQAVNSAQKQLFANWDAALDATAHGPKWLKEPAIANLVCDELHSLDGRLYSLEAYCLMPNHVHLVCTPGSVEGEYVPLAKILRALKGKTARQANLLLGRQGAFWQHESYDHVVRDHAELNRIVNYVLDNPRRAGLPDLWIYAKDITDL
jgi:REP element-mobilizing transposase RayT